MKIDEVVVIYVYSKFHWMQMKNKKVFFNDKFNRQSESIH